MILPLPLAILFDLDGTLADTAPDLAAAVNQVRTARGLDPVAYAELRPFASAGARGLIGAAFHIRPDDPRYPDLRDEFLGNYIGAIAVNTTLFPGVAELLNDISARDIAWGVVTNKAAYLTERLVPNIGLQDAACVISGDTTPFSKPHPEPLLEAARRLKVDPCQCWYVGDDIRDIEAGQAAGMHTIAAGWGYCGQSTPVIWGADRVANQPVDVLSFLPGNFR